MMKPLIKIGFYLALLLVTVLDFVTGDTMSACFGGETKSLDIKCGKGYMVRITRTFYGFSPTGQCRLVSGEAGEGCTWDDPVRNKCVGQPSCSVNLPTGQWGVEVPVCGQRSNYYQVEYSCILASSVFDICQHNRLTEQTGYIMTPNYPANYTNQGLCATTITAHPSQKLHLHIIEMDLQKKGQADCADELYFNDKLRSITLCGHRSHNSYDMHSNYLHIELQSTSRGKSKGFWLYYEAVPPLPTAIETPPPASRDNQEVQNDGSMPEETGHGMDNAAADKDYKDTTTPSYIHPKSTVPLIRNDTSSGKKLPFAAIAGGVIGTLSLILFILLLLLFIKWCRERRYQKAEKILEIRNPAFRSSNDFHEPSPNNGYYC